MHFRHHNWSCQTSQRTDAIKIYMCKTHLFIRVLVSSTLGSIDYSGSQHQCVHIIKYARTITHIYLYRTNNRPHAGQDNTIYYYINWRITMVVRQ